jgi:hypothetical protein
MGYYNVNRANFQLVTKATNNPVTLDDVKNFLKIDNSEEDVILCTFIEAAVSMAEKYTGIALMSQTRKLQLDWLPDGEYTKRSLADYPYPYQGAANRIPFFAYDNYIDLPYKPIQSVTSVVFVGQNNATSTFNSSNYYVDTVGGRIVLNTGASWNVDLRDRASVIVTYVCGFGSTSDSVPADIRMAIMQHVADMYNCRSVCGMSCGCEEILSKYKDYGDYSL